MDRFGAKLYLIVAMVSALGAAKYLWAYADLVKEGIEAQATVFSYVPQVRKRLLYDRTIHLHIVKIGHERLRIDLDRKYPVGHTFSLRYAPGKEGAYQIIGRLPNPLVLGVLLTLVTGFLLYRYRRITLDVTQRASERRQALFDSITEKLDSNELAARLFSEEGGGEIEYVGRLKKEANGYRLVIQKKEDTVNQVSTDIAMNSIDEVAEYLRAETKFVLTDFEKSRSAPADP